MEIQELDQAVKHRYVGGHYQHLGQPVHRLRRKFPDDDKGYGHVDGVPHEVVHAGPLVGRVQERDDHVEQVGEERGQEDEVLPAEGAAAFQDQQGNPHAQQADAAHLQQSDLDLGGIVGAQVESVGNEQVKQRHPPPDGFAGEAHAGSEFNVFEFQNRRVVFFCHGREGE